MDLILVGACSEPVFIEMIRKLETKLNREINFTLYTEKEFEKEKKNQGGFLNLVLNEKIILLKGTILGDICISMQKSLDNIV